MSATEQDWLYASDRRDAERNHINASWLLGKADDTIRDLKAQLETARGALESIAEYWNRNENEKAMSDACWHAIETAEAALARDEGKGVK